MAHSESAQPFPFGAAVIFTQTYHRKEKYLGGVTHYKEWVTRSERKPVDGLLIGYRTLVNGESCYEGREIGNVFHPKEYVKAALVATKLNRNPVLVPLESLFPA